MHLFVEFSYYKFDGNIIWDILIDTSYNNNCYNNGLIITDNNVIKNFEDFFYIYPNPLIQLSVLTLPADINLNNVVIDIIDIHGREVKTFFSVTGQQITLSRNNFNAQGVYFVRIFCKKYVETIKLLVQ